jgi:hypothetical protein
MSFIPRNLGELKSSVQTAPQRLLAICGCQILLLLIGVFVGHGAAECEIRLPQGSAIEVDCNRCRLLGGLRWRDIFILFMGCGTICIGVYAAVFKNKDYCRVYGLVMMVFAFVVGLTAVLTGLETPVLEAAAQAIGPGLVDCEKIAYMMVDNARDHSMLYGANCILDTLGALYAMWSKEKFDLDDIAASHAKANASFNDNL